MHSHFALLTTAIDKGRDRLIPRTGMLRLSSACNAPHYIRLLGSHENY